MAIKKVSSRLKQLLKENYPSKGKYWCCKRYGLTEAQVRYATAMMKLQLSQESRFWKDFQKRAAMAKVGKKRPGQSNVMKSLWRSGKLKPLKKKPRITVLCANSGCKVSWKTIEGKPRKFCSSKCGSKNKWLRFPHPRGMKNKTHSDKTKLHLGRVGKGRKVSRETIRRSMATRYANGWKPPKHGNWKAGRSDDLGDTYFRSSWERNYARYLNFLQKRKEIKGWEFEKDIFWFDKIKRGTVSYKPDFKVELPNGKIEYHEVKGWMDKTSLLKIKRMAKYHPHIKLIIVDQEAYKSIAKFGKVYSKFWE